MMRLRKLLKGLRYVPRLIVTDKVRSYAGETIGRRTASKEAAGCILAWKEIPGTSRARSMIATITSELTQRSHPNRHKPMSPALAVLCPSSWGRLCRGPGPKRLCLWTSYS